MLGEQLISNFNAKFDNLRKNKIKQTIYSKVWINSLFWIQQTFFPGLTLFLSGLLYLVILHLDLNMFLQWILPTVFCYQRYLRLLDCNFINFFFYRYLNVLVDQQELLIFFVLFLVLEMFLVVNFTIGCYTSRKGTFLSG